MLDSSPEDEDFPGRLLHQAALWDNTELLEDLLDGGQHAFINSQDSWGRTPLHAAAINTNSRCLPILLIAGADANLSCGSRGENKTALHLSAEHGHNENVLILLEYDVNLMARDGNGLTATDLADKNGHGKCVEILREAACAKEKARLDVHAAIRDACGQNDEKAVRQLLGSLAPKDAELIVNMAPSGANTLLFIGCQIGNKEIVKLLLEHGADGRYHSITKYSPLYIACYHGHRDIVEMVLLKFPELVQQHTVERWLPIHAACINGRPHILDLLFHFPYPSPILKKYPIDDQWEYSLPFDPNERDATGQTILYVACLLGNQKMLDVILKLRVKATRVQQQEMATPIGDDESDFARVSPTRRRRRRRISDGIQSIMSRLSLSTTSFEGGGGGVKEGEKWVCPVKVDLYCNVAGAETALHAAIKGRHFEMVGVLLGAGADVNAVVKAWSGVSESGSTCCAPDDDTIPTQQQQQQSSGLVEACLNHDLPLIDLLLQHGARDDDCKALQVAYVTHHDATLTSKLLAIKANPDPEYKINKKAMTAQAQTVQMFSKMAVKMSSNLTYSAMFSNQPVMVNWHNLRCGLTEVKKEWLTEAAITLNSKLRGGPRGAEVALFAITRLDLSMNSLIEVPEVVMQLVSLRYLNLAQNKIEKLPEPPPPPDPQTKKQSRRKSAIFATGDTSATPTTNNNNNNYNCLVLEELYLQDNRLDQLPEAIFRLPNLVTLVVSNNKLQELPSAIWMAPKLKELNAAFNLLKELPLGGKPAFGEVDFDKLSVSSSDSQLSSSGGATDDFDVTEFEAAAEAVASVRGNDEITAVRYRKKDKSFLQIDLTKHHMWTNNIEVTEQIHHSATPPLEASPTDLPPDSPSTGNILDCHSSSHHHPHHSQLSSLNLAHNLFTAIPTVLPCLAVKLTRLNMAFNSLRSMSHITSYPSALKQLDLSHNGISVWPSLPQVEAKDEMELRNLACYGVDASWRGGKGVAEIARRQSGRSVRHTVLHSVCAHRRHLRLDNLRTLILSDNQLTRIQLATDDDGDFGSTDDNNEDNTNSERNAATNKTRLMFPNLSMLDVCNNNLKEIPTNIYELSNLSVLNLSGNLDINELPPQMGLLSRLWNLNTRGCALQEPIKSMIDSKKYKTMDLIGYLKSVLEDARPYARMKLMIVGVQGIGKTSLLEQLRQEGVTRKKAEHWAKRMGNKNINVKTSRGVNMSTVGVDIGDWVYEKKVRSQSSHGPVVFRTWDFGGQKEYYATHQYFLSKRSLYLVVWKITDSHRGINEILQWLVNIQARAPNSPVIIVGTHYDVVQEFDPHISEEYQQLIRDRFINIVDAEKCGLPRVLDTIEVSCKTRHNVKLLCNLVYDTVFSLRPPGSKELLLEQKVPATYLALEDVVGYVAAERRTNGLDPVLNAEQYRTIVTTEMLQRYNKTFRDWAELHQATLFLHDNGVLLHYDDATLKDLYFLDPQWLCDMLAHIITIREINPFARTGIMKLDDLKHIFKSLPPTSTATSFDPTGRSYIVNLLNKFEVALTWDSRTLLIPSLLPSEDDLLGGNAALQVKVRVPLRSRGWAVKKVVSGRFQMRLEHVGRSTEISHQNQKIDIGIEQIPLSPTQQQQQFELKIQNAPSHETLSRLLLMSYFPSGFWSRLISRVLADDTIVDIIRSFFVLPKEVAQDAELVKLLDLRAEWVLWQTGLQLNYGEVVLMRMREVLHNSSAQYRQLRFKMRQDGIWCDLDLQSTSILEIHFPMKSLIIRDLTHQKLKTSDHQITIPSSKECTAQLLALAVDHIDILLEDWYPTLGTRFVHTSEGRFLITRLVPCPDCLVRAVEVENNPTEFNNQLEIEEMQQVRRNAAARKSQESCDSGMGHDESRSSSRLPSMEGYQQQQQMVGGGVGGGAAVENSLVFYSWMVEECILAAYTSKCVVCPLHGDVGLSRVAPDTIFQDLPDRHLIKPTHIIRSHLLGRGAFGFVFRGTILLRGSNHYHPIAMKMLQPVPPGSHSSPSALIAYKAAQCKWDRDPLQYACKAYCTARQELNILLALRHPNIVPFVGVCTQPLALVLDLAPQGALDAVLRNYRRSGARMGDYAVQAVVLQVAKAIEYLHRQRIIYRDLKSENVLVWQMPPPFTPDHPTNPIHIKVADYGISRLTLPSGTKGFGGTEGFMAPEIMRYNGEEEYTEKVDCFSFGMFIYELLTLHQPFEGHEAVKECILDGGRPPLTYRETLYPSYFLDLMVLCWSQQPKDRPSASQIVSIATAPEFTHLCDVATLKHQAPVVAATSAAITNITDDGLCGSEMWLMCANSRIDLLLAADRSWLQYHTMSLPIRPTTVCTVGNAVWIGDYVGRIHAYSASDGYKLFSYAMENDNTDSAATTPSQVECLLHLPTLNRVAVALSNGRLFLVHSDAIPSTPTSAEGTFVMTELGSNSVIHCLCALFMGDDDCELWCGESSSQISIYTIKDQVVFGHETLHHHQPTPTPSHVKHLCTPTTSTPHQSVYSYVQPGCIIYQWSSSPTTTTRREIANKLDCSKLVPCSESLKSIAIEEHLSPTNCQITCLMVFGEEVYVGTTWGCVIVAEKESLRPITIFRPFEEEVRAIVALPVLGRRGKEEGRLVGTVGRGYRSLLARYTDGGVGEKSVSGGSMVVLLWKGEFWNPV